MLLEHMCIGDDLFEFLPRFCPNALMLYDSLLSLTSTVGRNEEGNLSYKISIRSSRAEGRH